VPSPWISYVLLSLLFSEHGSTVGAPVVLFAFPDVRSVLDFAGREAAAMGRIAIGAEHLLLGLLREPTGVAGVVLRKLRVDLDQARAEILKTIGPDDTAGPAPALAS
jgi:hypothetical protein